MNEWIGPIINPSVSKCFRACMLIGLTRLYSKSCGCWMNVHEFFWRGISWNKEQSARFLRAICILVLIQAYYFFFACLQFEKTALICCCSLGDDLSCRLSVCVDEVSSWMSVNRLQLNTAKTEVLWCSSSRRQHQIPTTPVRIGPTSILPVSSVRDLGVYLDADATMTTHVKACRHMSCSAALRQIRSVRRSLSQHALLTFIRALVVSKVDYCCWLVSPVISWADYSLPWMPPLVWSSTPKD